MASEIGSGDLDAITPTRMISALFGMVIRLKTHVQSMVNHGTGVSRASAWAITPAKITVTANILHRIGTKMTNVLLTEETRHTLQVEVHLTEAISQTNQDTCRKTAVERHSQKRITIIIKIINQLTAYKIQIYSV